MNLRPYQQECIETIQRKGAGRWLIQMATGLGKTVVFGSLPRAGRVLILSHREELVRQPLKYFDCLCGIEQGEHRAGYEDVVSASVQTMARRLDKWAPSEFETIIVDEAHHSSATTYRAILDHFKPRRVLGFTATPNRGDGVGLEKAFDEIIFERDLRWGISNGFLSPIHAVRLRLGFDLSAVRTKMGDFASNDLEKAVNIEGANAAIAEAFRDLADKPALIFGVSVAHAHAIASHIEGAVALDGTSRDRSSVVEAFANGEIPALVNCGLFTEGTDLPGVKTIIIARPTQSGALYAQMVGRGTRLAPGKTRCLLIDCVGVTRKPICTAPSLIGLDMAMVPTAYQDTVCGDLLADIPKAVERSMDTPAAWIRNVEMVDLWARATECDVHDVRYFRYPDGRMRVSLPDAADKDGNKIKVAGRKIKRWVDVMPPDLIGKAMVRTSLGREFGPWPVQRCFDWVYTTLRDMAAHEKPVWSLASFRRWGAKEATPRQKELIQKRGVVVDMETLTKGQATEILQRLFG